jgi:hypothetical protein
MGDGVIRYSSGNGEARGETPTGPD